MTLYIDPYQSTAGEDSLKIAFSQGCGISVKYIKCNSSLCRINFVELIFCEMCKLNILARIKLDHLFTGLKASKINAITFNKQTNNA